MSRTQAVYYRDQRGVEPVDDFIEGLPPKRAAKIDDYVEEYLNGRPPDAPPPDYPITSQIEGGCVSCVCASQTPAFGSCTSGPSSL